MATQKQTSRFHRFTIGYLALPVLGGLLLGLWLWWFAPDSRKTGVAHVMACMAKHKGHMPISNTVRQLIGGSLAILTGQSACR